jgi:hypothetical protein
MSLHGAPCHVELRGNFGIVTTLQKQFDNLLFARPQPNSLVFHLIPLFSFSFCFADMRGGTLPISIAPALPLLRIRRVNCPEDDFPQRLAAQQMSFRKSRERLLENNRGAFRL